MKIQQKWISFATKHYPKDGKSPLTWKWMVSCGLFQLSSRGRWVPQRLKRNFINTKDRFWLVSSHSNRSLTWQIQFSWYFKLGPTASQSQRLLVSTHSFLSSSPLLSIREEMSRKSITAHPHYRISGYQPQEDGQLGSPPDQIPPIRQLENAKHPAVTWL